MVIETADYDEATLRREVEKRERRPTKETWRAKGWYEIFAPSMFGGARIGETPAMDAHQLEGRVLEGEKG